MRWIFGSFWLRWWARGRVLAYGRWGPGFSCWRRQFFCLHTYSTLALCFLSLLAALAFDVGLFFLSLAFPEQLAWYYTDYPSFLLLFLLNPKQSCTKLTTWPSLSLSCLWWNLWPIENWASSEFQRRWKTLWQLKYFNDLITMVTAIPSYNLSFTPLVFTDTKIPGHAY